MMVEQITIAEAAMDPCGKRIFSLLLETPDVDPHIKAYIIAKMYVAPPN